MTKNIKTEKILKQVQNDKNVETGRSMTEMLGTLAIIGVLSIGGIAGYRYAMNKHYANELLLGASERVVLVTAQIVAGREPSLKEFANHTTAGGTFATDKVEVYSDGIGIKVSGVNGAVCDNLIKAIEDTDIVIADTQGKALSAGDCKDDTNDLLFVFERGIGSGEKACGFGKYNDANGCVECPLILSEITDSNICLNCGGTWDGSSCVGECSNSAYKDKDGICRSCFNSAGYFASADECMKCLKTEKPRYMDNAGRCISCSSSSDNVTPEQCSMCDGSQYPTYLSNNNCYPCSVETAWEATLESCSKCGNLRYWHEGRCFISDCGKDRFHTMSSCQSCFEVDGTYTTNEGCDECMETSSPRFMSEDNACFPCFQSYPIKASEEECRKCGNERYMTNDGYCALTSCGYDRYTNEDGECRACGDVSFDKTSEEACNKCKGTAHPRFLASNNNCYSCSHARPMPSTPEQCANCGEMRTYNTTTGKCARAS